MKPVVVHRFVHVDGLAHLQRYKLQLPHLFLGHFTRLLGFLSQPCSFSFIWSTSRISLLSLAPKFRISSTVFILEILSHLSDPVWKQTRGLKINRGSQAARHRQYEYINLPPIENQTKMYITLAYWWFESGCLIIQLSVHLILLVKIWYQFHAGLAPIPSMEIAADYFVRKEGLYQREFVWIRKIKGLVF